MNSPPTFAQVFLTAGGKAGALEEGALAETLDSLVGEGASAWVSFALPAQQFVEHLAHCSTGDHGDNYLSRVRAADLYLALACAKGIPAALQEFEKTVLLRVPSFVARVDASPSFADEICQQLRTDLLVRGPDKRQKILEYAGTGVLGAWVRMVAHRKALNLIVSRADKRYVPIDEQVATAAAGPDMELDYLKRRYGTELTEALRAAFASLPRDQRHVLRLQFKGGHSGQRIATLLGVHRATVARWFASAKVAMFEEVRRILRARLGLADAEFESLVEVLRSRLEVTIGSLIQDSAELAEED